MIECTFVKILEWRAEGKSHKVMARRVKQVTSMGRVNIKEDTRNNDSLFFQQLFEESLGLR